MQLVLHQGAEARTHAKPLELLDGALYLDGLEKHGVAEADLLEVLGLKHEVWDGLLKAVELLGAGLLTRISLTGTLGRHKVLPGEDLRVGLAHGR